MTYQEKITWLTKFFENECVRAKRQGSYPDAFDNTLSARTVLEKLNIKPDSND